MIAIISDACYQIPSCACILMYFSTILLNNVQLPQVKNYTIFISAFKIKKNKKNEPTHKIMMLMSHL